MKGIANPDRDSIRHRMEWLVADPGRMTEEMVEVRYRIWPDPETRLALENLFRAHLVDGTPKVKYDVDPDEIGRIQTPTMVLWTEHNPGDGPDVGRYIADHIPGSVFALSTTQATGHSSRSPRSTTGSSRTSSSAGAEPRRQRRREPVSAAGWRPPALPCNPFASDGRDPLPGAQNLAD